MRLVGSGVDVVERIYDVDQPAESWLASIRDAAERCFEEHMGVQAYTLRVDATGGFELEQTASEPGLHAVFQRAHGLASGSTVCRIYLTGPLVDLTRVMKGRESDSGYRAVLAEGSGT